MCDRTRSSQGSISSLRFQIIGNLLVRESVRLPLGCRSSYIPYRHRILDWMCRAKEALRICEEVHQLAVYFFDRFVDGASTLFLESKLDLHVLCCIQLAGKMISSIHLNHSGSLEITYSFTNNGFSTLRQPRPWNGITGSLEIAI